MFYTLLVGVFYSTGYTSRLTIPQFSKPINTIHDFVQQGIYWVVNGNSTLVRSLRSIDSYDYKMMADRAVNETKDTETIQHLRTNRFGVLTKVLSNNYLTDIDDIAEETTRLRLMKSCLFKQYSTLAFEKYSPYTKFFNFNIKRFVISIIFIIL